MSEGPGGHSQGEQPAWASPEPAREAPPSPAFPTTAPVQQPVPGGWGAPPPGPYAAAPYWSPPPPNPGVVPLRPLGVMEILDGAIGTIRANPKSTLGLAAVVAALTTAVQIAATVLFLGTQLDELGGASGVEPVSRSQFESLASGGISSIAITFVVGFVAGVVLTGMLTAVVGRAVLGRHADLRSVWQQARPRLPALFGVSLAVLAVTFLLFGIAVGGAVGLGFATSSVAVGVVAGLLLGVPAVVAVLWVGVVTVFAGPSVVLERQPVRAALRRSRALVRGSFWRVVGVLVLVHLIAGVIGGILSVPFAVVSTIIRLAMGEGSTAASVVPQLVSGVGSVLSGTITTPFVAAATALLYIDQRMRREGLDLELSRVVAEDRARPDLSPS